MNNKENAMTMNEFFSILGVDRYSAVAVTVWDTLEHHGYKIVKPVGDVMRWVNCYDRVPHITKWYTIRNWITGRDSASVYCDSKDAIQKYCEANKLDFPEFQWLEENVKPVEGETITEEGSAIRNIYDAFANWYMDDGSYDNFLAGEAWEAILQWQAKQAKIPETITGVEEAAIQYWEKHPHLDMDSCCEIFTDGAKWQAQQAKLPVMQSEAEAMINYIQHDAEILIPVERLFNEDKTHITQKKYGLILLEFLCAELREKFLTPKQQ